LKDEHIPEQKRVIRGLKKMYLLDVINENKKQTGTSQNTTDPGRVFAEHQIRKQNHNEKNGKVYLRHKIYEAT
jgi:hypothetical protein